MAPHTLRKMDRMPAPLEVALNALAPGSGDRLARVTAARDAARALEEVGLYRSVAEAREHGATWAQVGEALGVTGAAAAARFGGSVKEREERAAASRERAAERNRVASEAIGATPRTDLPGMSLAEAAEQLDLKVGTFRRRVEVARAADSSAFRSAIEIVQLSPKREVMRVVDIEAARRL